MLGTLKKAGQVIGLFTKDQPELGVTEVAEALRMPKSSAYGILSSLSEIGLLRRTPDNRYRLGWRLLGLGSILVDTTEFRVEAVPVMQRLVSRYGETAHLAVLEGFHVVCLEKLAGSRATRTALSGIGDTLPAHCSALGKALLADRSPGEVRDLASAHGLPAYTDRTITDLERLQAELDQVRREGLAYDLEEFVPHVCCIAAPIRDFTGQTVAAMSLSVPVQRFRRSRERFRLEMLRAAREVSENLGYIPAAGKGRGFRVCYAREG